TNVVKGEAGGITQHIGAYQVEKKGRAITFIDTPGHEAFTVMRSRGARVADVAILVVALDDGVQPQTKEVIDIIKAAKLPFVVALNKVDKPDVDIQKVKTQLSDQGFIPEDWGGSTVMTPVSAKTGQGIDELLDTILLVADMDKEKIRANPDQRAIGTVIESHVDGGEGVVATVLVQTGTLRRNDVLAVGGTSFGRVRAMKDWNGETVDEASPGMPVKIIGFKTATRVGDIVEVPEDAKSLKKAKKAYGGDKPGVAVQQVGQGEDVESEEKKILPVILKADVLGSLEAITGTLEKMKTPDVAVAVVSKGLGNVTESDVMQAEATGGVVMGFNVHATREANVLARDKNVEVGHYEVIYELFDELKRRLQELLPAEVIKTELGKLEVLATFQTDKRGQVIGGRVKDAKLIKGAKFVVYRGEEPVDEGEVLGLQVGKSDTNEVSPGSECGMKISSKRAIEIGDIIDTYTIERKERVLELPL
ncbi:translation initiation factor IF-2, partial [Patescibacteria group bacterium]